MSRLHELLALVGILLAVLAYQWVRYHPKTIRFVRRFVDQRFVPAPALRIIDLPELLAKNQGFERDDLPHPRPIKGSDLWVAIKKAGESVPSLTIRYCCKDTQKERLERVHVVREGVGALIINLKDKELTELRYHDPTQPIVTVSTKEEQAALASFMERVRGLAKVRPADQFAL
jgi:hypothetical protein